MFQRWLLQGLVAISLLLCLTSAYAEEQVGIAVPLKGALCLIRVDNKVLLVNEIITQQLSLPGGTIKPNEAPELTAKRETWEETGIVVTAGKILGYTKQAVVYDCIADAEILAYQYQNSLGGYELPVWRAPDYGVEVASAMLVAPDLVSSNQYRFPDGWPDTQAMFKYATVQQVHLIANLIQEAPAWHQTELIWIQSFQQWVSGFPNLLKSLVHNVIIAGSYLASPISGVILFPIIYWRSGKSLCYKVSFAITITSLVCLLAQQGFALPRPHAYFPDLQLVTSYGNGFPSLAVAVWSSIGMLMLPEKERFGGIFFSLIYLVCAVWLTVSKFYIGSAFLVDMFVGGLLGLLITWNIARFDIKRGALAKTLMGSKTIWWSITCITALLTYIYPLPVFGAWLAVLLIMSIVTSTLLGQRERISFIHALTMLLVLNVVYMSISYAATFVSTSSLWSLVVEFIRYPCMIIVFVLMIQLLGAKSKQAIKPS